jgi:hypothetical protein
MPQAQPSTAAPSSAAARAPPSAHGQQVHQAQQEQPQQQQQQQQADLVVAQAQAQLTRRARAAASGAPSTLSATPAALELRRQLRALAPSPPHPNTGPLAPGRVHTAALPSYAQPVAPPTAERAQTSHTAAAAAAAAADFSRRRERLVRIALDFSRAASGDRSAPLVDEAVMRRLAEAWADDKARRETRTSPSKGERGWSTLGN